MSDVVNIKDVNLGLDLKGSEGMDVNHLSRARAQYLFEQHNVLIQQIQFADAKAAAVMTLVGIMALRGPIDLMADLMTPMSIVFGVASSITVLFCLLSVFPRYPGTRVRKKLTATERWSWPGLASGELSPQEYASFLQTCEMSQLLHSVAVSNAKVAQVLLQKFLFLRLAFIAAAVSVLLLLFRVFLIP